MVIDYENKKYFSSNRDALDYTNECCKTLISANKLAILVPCDYEEILAVGYR